MPHRPIRSFRLPHPLPLLGAVVALVAPAFAAPAPSPALDGAARRALAALRAEAPGALEASVHPATGTVRFLRLAEPGGALPVAAAKSAGTEARARAFLREHGQAFGVRDPQRELVGTGILHDALGGQHTSFHQVHRGLPVLGTALRLHFDADGELYAVNGTIVPDLDLGIKPRTARGEARNVAIAAVVCELATAPDGATAAAPNLASAGERLVIFHDGLTRGVRGESRLAWEVTVRDGDAGSTPRAVHERVYVDALRGRVIARHTRIHSALDRIVYRGNTSNVAWREGDPLPYSGSGDAALDGAINRLITSTGDAYRFFERLSGGSYLSYNGSSIRMGAVANALSGDDCPNANWNGTTTNFCDTTAVDDVIAHEWTHAYTQHTHDLIYEWQPGALNEAYSDIYGETVDQLDGTGTDEPQGRRSDGRCSTLGNATRPTVTILAPGSIAGTYAASGAQFGPSLSQTSAEGAVVLAEDASTSDGPSTTDGCTALTNAAAVAGKLALVDRGDCTFVVKVKNAQNAGAIGVIVVNNQGEDLVNMAGEDATITIPSAFVRQSDGTRFKTELANGLTARIGSGAVGGDASHRWLIGEDDAGSGASIRDMWTPGCLNSPGRTNDAAYFCTTGSPNRNNDNGGVHVNSGVVNHAYALLVDGGTFNGRTIPAIGVIKAAHLWWRAMTVYQTPTSDFADHADALTQSCADLAAAGTNLPSLTQLGPSGERISSADCAALATAIAATELGSNTTRCNYAPLLTQSPPARCAGGGSAQPFFTANFEGGAAGFTQSAESPMAGVAPEPWRLSNRLPDRRAGSAFFAPAELAQCNLNFESKPQVKHLDSPTITIPNDVTNPRLAFRHWVATGRNKDGANLKLSVNGGAFSLVPDAAIRFNPYTASINNAENPLNGQRAWSGTDAGSHEGSWGETQVDLTGLARPGDRIRLRFDLGTAGCGEGEGWYVDDVEAYSCQGGGGGGACVADADTICLLDGRYALEVDWQNQFNGATGRGIANPRTDLTGFFAFDDPSNVELIVKMIDFEGTVKVFYGQLTNLRFTLTITDTETGAQKQYGNTAGECGAIDQAAFQKALPVGTVGSCVASNERLCLQDNRFAVEVDWRNQFNNQSGAGRATPLSNLTGQFSFTDPSNIELLAKTLDFGDRILFIYGALSDLEYTVRLTDTTTGAVKSYHNPPGTYCGGIDDDAF